jgi:hypothetical protein
VPQKAEEKMDILRDAHRNSIHGISKWD